QQIDPVQGPTTTVAWRDPFLNRPEQRLVGVQFTSWFNDASGSEFPYQVINSSNWVYRGTGVADGDTIPNTVGYEVDRLMREDPRIEQMTANVLDNFLGRGGPGSFSRPQSAASLDTALVPAFRQCGTGGAAPNAVHAPPPLGGGPGPDQSCGPPRPISAAARV